MTSLLALHHWRDLFTDIFTDTFGSVVPGLADNALTLTIPAQSLEITMSNWHAGDTEPALAGVASTDGAAVDLTGAACVVHVRTSSGTLLSRAPAVAAGTSGAWSLPWLATELDVPGVFTAELEVTRATGRITTFGPVSFRVDPQLA